jgi:hypothetical protein
MTTNQFFELCAKSLWPVLRHFVKLSKRCRICILSERCTPLENGICCDCRNYHQPENTDLPPVTAETQSRFSQRIQSAINTNPYHGIVLLSGGKDSAYLLHRLKKEFPQLQLLCVVVNNGFMSPQAIDGAKLSAEKMKCDLLIFNAAVDQFALKLRAAFLNLKGRGSYGVIDNADGTLIFDLGEQIARQMNIPLVFTGLSWVQLKLITGKTDFEENRGQGVSFIFPLIVWRTSETEIRDTVRSLGLLPPGAQSPVTSNSTLILTMSVLDVLNNGYSSFEPEFAQLIREKKADRKTWLYIFELLEFAATRGFLNNDVNATLKKLNLTLADLRKGDS